jgi:hypothetical protein
MTKKPTAIDINHAAGFATPIADLVKVKTHTYY